MKTTRKLDLCTGMAAVSLLIASVGWAADYNWNSTSSGNWSDGTASGWNTGGAYPNAQDDTTTFSQDIGANLAITLNVADARTGTLTLSDTGPSHGWTLSGANALTFDSSTGTATLTVQGSGSGPSNAHLISAPIASAVPVMLNVGSNARLGLSGNNAAATGGMTISGDGSGGYVRFDAEASLGNPGSSVTVEAGNAAVIGFSNLSSSDLARFAASDGLLTLYSSILASPGTPWTASGYSPAANIDLTGFNEYFRIGAATIPWSGNMSTLTGTFIPAADTFRFGGGGGALVVNATLTDGGAGRDMEIRGPERVDTTHPSMVALTAPATYTGATNVVDGILRVAGANGTMQNTSAINVGSGTALQLDAGLKIFGWGYETGSLVGNNNDRIGDTTPVNLNHATLYFFGNPDTGTTETVGALSIQSGLAVLDARWKAGTVNYGAGNTYTDRGGAGTGAAVLTAQSLNQSSGAHLWLRGDTVGVAGGSATRVMLNTAPTMVGGGGAGGSTAISILPGVFHTAGLTASQNSNTNNWVMYDAAVGLRPLSTGAGEYYAFGTGDVGTSTDNNAVYQQAGAGTTLTISSSTTVNSMKFQFEPTGGNMTVAGTAPLVLKSGNLLVEGNPPGDGRNFYLNVPLDFSGQAGNVLYFTDSFTGYQFNSVMSNTGGNGVSFTAFNTGSYMGAVPIGGSSTYTGPTNINAGNWQTSGSERLPDATDLRVRSGGQLTVGAGATETVASLAGTGTLALGNTSSQLNLGGGGSGGAVTMDSAAAFIAPGDSVGTITLSGADLVVINGNVQIEIESAVSADQIRVIGGDVTLSGGTLVLSFLDGYLPEAGAEWKIFDLDDGFTLSGMFPETRITAPTKYVFDTYASGNDLMLRSYGYIPEPTSVVLMAAAGAIMALRRRRAAGKGH